MAHEGVSHRGDSGVGARITAEAKREAHRSLILETCLKIWKFSLQRDNDVEVLWRFPRSLDTMGGKSAVNFPINRGDG